MFGDGQGTVVICVSGALDSSAGVFLLVKVSQRIFRKSIIEGFYRV